MNHLGEGTLQALLDGELAPGDRAAAEAHLSACAACAGELAELRAAGERASALLGMVESAPPVLRAQAGFARRRRAGWTEGRRALARAAALVVLLAGAAAAAVPGSPVRGWVQTLAGGGPAPDVAEAPALEPAPAAPPAPGDEAPPTGVSILPDGGRVRVVVSGASPELRVRTRLSAGPRVEVTARGAAVSARFRTSPGRIEVMGAGPGEVVVDLPAGAEAAFVEVNGRVVAAREGDRLRALAPTVAGSASEPVFRAGN